MDQHSFISLCADSSTKISDIKNDMLKNINCTDVWDMTPILYASRSGNVELVKFLYENGANINLSTCEGTNVLMWAVMKNHINVVKYLTTIIDKNFINNEDANGWTALMLASYNDNFEITKLLLEHKADTHIKNKNGFSVLKYASSPKINSLINKYYYAKSDNIDVDKIETEELKDLVTCSICMINLRNVVFYPCCHSFCSNCKNNLTSCPVCRSKIEKKLSISGGF